MPGAVPMSRMLIEAVAPVRLLGEYARNNVAGSPVVVRAIAPVKPGLRVTVSSGGVDNWFDGSTRKDVALRAIVNGPVATGTVMVSAMVAV